MQALSDATDARVSAFGSVEAHTPIEVKAARYRVQEGFPAPWGLVASGKFVPRARQG
ncbi:hypothetical protein [Halococcus thailandensis]|uniref:hypothetical protein n=1 Tax=Halococcus thailandensis TaxID=335952 RepID=UPI000A4D7505|nr:hypothetical protein [Halococcus thailandensis]